MTSMIDMTSVCALSRRRSSSVWTPAELFAVRSDTTGDWFKYALSKIYSTIGAASPYDGITNASAVDDPVAQWRGYINDRLLMHTVAGNRPKLGVGGVRFVYNTAERGLGAFYEIDADVPYTTPRTIWAKILFHSLGNGANFIGSMNTSEISGAAFSYTTTFNSGVRNGFSSHGAITTGEHKLILRSDQSSIARTFIDDLAEKTVAIGTNTVSTQMEIVSKTAGLDFTVLDFGVIHAAITDAELASLKTYLDGVTA